MQCLLAYEYGPNCPFLTQRGNWECLLCKWVQECTICAIITKNFHFEICNFISLSFSGTIAACHSELTLEDLL
jgi:hypothetical protein